MPSGIWPSDTMNAHLIPVNPGDRPHVRAVKALVARYGRVRVALAFANVAFRRRPVARQFESDISDRLRRDTGLDPLPRGRNYWEL